MEEGLIRWHLTDAVAEERRQLDAWYGGSAAEEIRVTFMGQPPLPRPGQMGTSVTSSLATEEIHLRFRPGSIANYLAAKVPLNQINDIFITHLHWTISPQFPMRCVRAWAAADETTGLPGHRDGRPGTVSSTWSTA